VVIWRIVVLLLLLNLVLVAVLRQDGGSRVSAVEPLSLGRPPQAGEPQNGMHFGDPDAYREKVFLTLLDPSRDAFLKPARVITALAVRDGDVVADLGAGSGYFDWRLSAAVGQTGRVLAIDIDPVALGVIKRRIRETPPPHPNIEIIRNTDSDVCVRAGVLDLTILCDVHFFVDPRLLDKTRQTLATLYQATKPGGRVAVIENRTNPTLARVTEETVGAPFIEAGFKLQKKFEFLPYHVFIVLERPH
jgi:hypothetical protein